MVPYPGVYRLNIVLVQGHDLAAKDKGGNKYEPSTYYYCFLFKVQTVFKKDHL